MKSFCLMTCIFAISMLLAINIGYASDIPSNYCVSDDNCLIIENDAGMKEWIEERVKIESEATPGINAPIVKIILCDGVTEIPRDAFRNMKELQEIEISNTVTSIGMRAFEQSEKLTALHIPAGITIIEPNISNSLTEITVSEENSHFSLIDGMLVEHASKRIVLAEKDICEIVAIDDSIEEIGDWAFNGCYNLEEVILGNNVKKIGLFAFADCRNLKSMTMNDSLSYIYGHAFSSCYSLKIIEIPANCLIICDDELDIFSNSGIVAMFFHGSNSVTSPNTFRHMDYLRYIVFTDIKPTSVELDRILIQCKNELVTLYYPEQLSYSWAPNGETEVAGLRLVSYSSYAKLYQDIILESQQSDSSPTNEPTVTSVPEPTQVTTPLPTEIIMTSTEAPIVMPSLQLSLIRAGIPVLLGFCIIGIAVFILMLKLKRK